MTINDQKGPKNVEKGTLNQKKCGKRYIKSKKNVEKGTLNQKKMTINDHK